jgi:endonuclease/exonuclease/phosphatase family metal-dependent hydrolase
LRLASFNVENLTADPGAAAPLAARLEILRPQLERLSADVLCLQEVDASRHQGESARTLEALTLLLEETRYRDFHLASTVDAETGHPRDKHNLIILSRWPIRRSAQYANDLVRPPRYRGLPDGGALHVVNMHLRAPLAAFIPGEKTGPFSWRSVSGWAEGYFLASVKRSGQALEARMLIDRLFDEDPAALIAVAGDFNSEEREVPLRIVVGDPENTGSGRLSHRSLVILEHSLPLHQRFTVIHRGQRLMLDHLLVSRRLLARYRHIEVHNEALGDELVAYTQIDAAPDSYHAPIVAQFEDDGKTV